MKTLLCLKQQSNAYKCSDMPGIANVHFTFSSVFAIIMLHRVAFLRKSSCRSATLFLFPFKSDSYISIGKNIRKLRLERSYTQASMIREMQLLNSIS